MFYYEVIMNKLNPVLLLLMTFFVLFAGISQADDCAGIFGPHVAYVVNSKPISIFAGDLDSDGDQDIAVACYFREFMSVILNNGDGTFAFCDWYLVPYYTEWIDGADFDGDEDIDIVEANSQDGKVGVLLNNGDGTFAPRIDYITYGNPRSVCAAKLDNDDDYDLVAANYWAGKISVLMNNGNGTFAGYQAYDVSGGPRSVFVADLDNDLDNDIVTANLDSNTVSVFHNDGLGVFTLRSTRPVGPAPFVVYAADFNGDNASDLATANSGNGTISVLFNTGNGATFGPPATYSVGDEPVFVTGLDVDKDGNIDLAVANSDDNTVSVLLNNGDGNFGYLTSYLTGINPYSIAVADFDLDNHLDIGVALFMSNYVSILYNVDAVPFTGSVAGLVTNYLAEPIEGVHVYAQGNPTGVYSQSNGSYNLSDLCATPQDIFFSHPDYCDTAIAGIRIPANDTFNLSLMMNFRSLAGLITDEELNPLESVYVEIQGSEFSGASKSDGAYYFGCVEAGSHEIVFSHPRYCDTTLTGIEVQLNDTTILNVQLQPRGFIKGVVVDELDQPIDSIIVSVVGTNITDTTGDGGEYVLNYINAGLQNIYFGNIYYYDTTVIGVEVQPGDTTELDAALRRRPDLEMWYGSIGCEPILASIGTKIAVDLYLQTAGYIQLESSAFILGADNTYISGFFSESDGEYFYPFDVMDQAGFAAPAGSPPNQTGWLSQSFTAQSIIMQSPWFYFDVPAPVVRYIVEITDNTSLVGDTVNCFGFGVDENGDSSYAFSFSGALTIAEHFCRLVITDDRGYLPGDINMSAGVWPPAAVGADVTYLVNYFRSLPSSVPCFFDGFWASADANGDCNIIGNDVTMLVNYFRGSGSLFYCPDYLPLWPTPADLPPLAPYGWPNCDPLPEY